MNELPEKFLQVMQEILQDEYDDFLAGFSGKRYRALRVNPLRTDPGSFEEHAPFPLRKIPWVEGGYFYEEGTLSPSRHPYYAAGVYYLQEPSAMTPASRLPVVPGDRVLDLCAAPGGKATGLGAALRGKGVLVANDINKARAKALLHNIELFGITNAFVTNEPPHILAERFPDYFDKIMVDAPCSGEGMFRKNPAVIEAWKEKGPDYFSNLQKNIVLCAADMLRPGGSMFYSTCTFSPLENEAVISHLLRERPDMELIPMEDYEGFAEGLKAFAGESFDESCHLCRRVWPHRMEGEGHFLALLRKKGGCLREEKNIVPVQTPLMDQMPADGLLCQDVPGKQRERSGGRRAKRKGTAGKHRKSYKGNPGRDDSAGSWWQNRTLFDQEESEILGQFFSAVSYPFRGDRIRKKGSRIFYVPPEIPENAGLHFLRNGLLLGELKKSRFEPAQPLALILSRETFGNSLSLSCDDPRLGKYLRGETLDLSREEVDLIRKSGTGEDDLERVGETTCGDDSRKMGMKKRRGYRDKADWVLILADDYPLGFGRLSRQTLKNKYPAGWRQIP